MRVPICWASTKPSSVVRAVKLAPGPRTTGPWAAILLAQVGYGLSPGTALLVGGGVEAFLTEADVYVAGQRAATIPHTQLVLELGVLSRF